MELSWVNLIVGWDWLRYIINWFSSDSGPGQMHKMSSMYLFHNSGLSRSFSSNSAMKMLAYEGAILVPMAVL